ncbi:MAG: IS200/IS605 family transposase [Reichenbachiella sp.]|uniref:IS200/IS605 family transposase n=1 Tax=Reichenbachiella sp. TaxID=2184521 RepID=UPI003298F9AF
MSRKDSRINSHSRSRLTAHLVWCTKYRYQVLKGSIQERCRELLIQICDAEDVEIIKGVVGKDHIHMHIEYPPNKNISNLVKRLKGRSSRRLQEEYSEIRRRYWGRHFWAIGYGVWSTGETTEDVVNNYLEHHRTKSNEDRGNMMLE